jgi:hypothetical protein
VIQHSTIADSSIILYLYTVLIYVVYSLSVLVVPRLVLDLNQEHEEGDGLVENLCDQKSHCITLVRISSQIGIITESGRNKYR